LKIKDNARAPIYKFIFTNIGTLFLFITIETDSNDFILSEHTHLKVHR
jgi:hypothetical protein